MAHRRAARAPSRRYFRRNRRGTHSTTFGALEMGGGLVSAASVATANINDGAPVWWNLMNGQLGPATYDISQTINPFGSDPRYAGQRDAFLTGIGLFVGGRVLRKLVPGLHRHGLKVGRRAKVALW